MLEQWAERAVAANAEHTACIVHAHLALLYKNCEPHEFNRQIVTTLIASQVRSLVGFCVADNPLRNRCS